MEFKNDNDYSCIWFFSNRQPIKWRYVHNVFKACQDVKRLHGSFNFVNVFVRRGGKKLRQYKEFEFIEPYPR